MRKFTKEEIDFIQDRACDRVTEIFDSFGIEYNMRIDYIQCACPIHCGDNPRGLYWAIQSRHWRCTTRHCEEDIITGKSNSIFGLVRGIMTQKTQQQWSFHQAIMYIAQLLNLQDIKITPKTKEEIEINKTIQNFRRKQRSKCPSGGLLISDVLPKLKPDTIYYPSRGISKDIISKYHISFCDNIKKPFYNRAFFPILNETGKYIVGWSARSVFDKCNKCKEYHDPKNKCSDYPSPKWKHSKGFKSENYLYNYWHAHPYISKYTNAIICEGPGDCWALEEAGIKNSVAIFGLNISKTQRLILQKAGALTLIIAFDNDESATKARKRLDEKLQYYFRIFHVSMQDAKDVGDMKTEDIKERFKDLLTKSSREDILSV